MMGEVHESKLLKMTEETPKSLQLRQSHQQREWRPVTFKIKHL